MLGSIRCWTVVAVSATATIGWSALDDRSASAQSVPPVGPGHCVQDCGGGTFTPSGSGGSGGPSRYEIERRKREAERKRSFYTASKRGYRAYKRGDWDAAIRYFRQALSRDPHNPNMQHNLRRAKERKAQALAAVQRRRAEQARLRRQREVAQRQAALKRQREQARQRKLQQDKRQALGRLKGGGGGTIKVKTGTGFFGGKSNPVGTTLKGVDETVRPTKMTPVEQAGSAVAHGGRAKRAGQAGDAEGAHHQATRVFDRHGEKAGGPRPVLKLKSLDSAPVREVPERVRRDPKWQALDRQVQKARVRQAQVEKKWKALEAAERSAATKKEKARIAVEKARFSQERVKARSAVRVAEIKREDFVRHVLSLEEKAPDKKPAPQAAASGLKTR